MQKKGVLKDISDDRWIRSLILYLKYDKKNNDKKINFILLKNIGKTELPNKFKISTSNLKKYSKTIAQSLLTLQVEIVVLLKALKNLDLSMHLYTKALQSSPH